MSYNVSRHGSADATAWDGFVRASRNGTFLLERGFMDYHADRFVDHSLLLHDDAGRLAAVLPAHETADGLASHRGLTYGGLVLDPGVGTAGVVAMLDAVRDYMRRQGMRALEYKTIPWIYHRQPSEDDRYALFLAGARLQRRDVLAVVARGHRPPYQARRGRGVRSAQRAGVVVAEGDALVAFWAVLEETLRVRHDAAPVHSLAEIERLRAAFPGRIRLFTALVDGVAAAGVVVFETDQVAHCQYIAANEAARTIGALDAVFDHLLRSVFGEKAFFDFGISNEDNGRVLNHGLIAHKEGFGARAVVHDHYVLDLEGST
jgi:hypothetical protein